MTKGPLTTITEEKVALVVGHSSSAQLNTDIGKSNSSGLSNTISVFFLFEDLGIQFLHFLTFYSTFIDIKDSSTPASV